jgi:hypothetical protein
MGRGSAASGGDSTQRNGGGRIRGQGGMGDIGQGGNGQGGNRQRGNGQAGNGQAGGQMRGGQGGGGMGMGMGMGGRSGRGGRGGGRANNSDYLFGGTYIVFVRRGGKPVPVYVSTGLTDLDYSEVKSGLTEKDSVLMLPSASFVQAQQDLQTRMKANTGLPGQTTTPATPGVGGGGGARQGGGGGGGRGGR